MDARTTDRGGSAKTPGLPIRRPEQLPPPEGRTTGEQRHQPENAQDQKPEKKPAPSFRDRIREHWMLASVAACALVIVLIGGLLYWLSIRHYESTDDAFIAARTFSISPKVGGYITDIPVTDNQHLKTGDVITEINHVPVASMEDYKSAVGKLKPGENVVFKVLRRADNDHTLTVFLPGVVPADSK